MKELLKWFHLNEFGQKTQKFEPITLRVNTIVCLSKSFFIKILFPLFAGYDDENGSYLKALHDHLVYRYEVLEVLGKGSFGQVVKALDHKTGQHVAVKIIRNKKRYRKSAFLECSMVGKDLIGWDEMRFDWIGMN